MANDGGDLRWPRLKKTTPRTKQGFPARLARCRRRRRQWRSFHATREGERGSGSAVVHGGASMAASAVAGESEGEEGRVSCVRGEGPGGSGVSKRVRSEWGGSRRWKQEVASPPVRAPRRRPPGKGRRRLAPGSGGLGRAGPAGLPGKAR